MAHSYTLKVVVSGKQVEVFKYSKEVWRDYDSSPKKVDTQKESKQLNMFEQEALRKRKVQYSINRIKTEIRRQINANPQLNKFMTLTFADNITDIKTANYMFNQFIKRISYKYKNFEYFAVPEFQRRGAVHYHVLCNLPYIEMGTLEYVWGHGHVNIRKVDEVANLGAYMSKYLGKELFSGRMFGKKKFFRSQSLKSPVELLAWWARKFIEKFLALLTPVFEKTFESEFIGEVQYKAYTLDDVVFKNGELDPSVLVRGIW